jgi:hypothetical protein
MKKKLLALLGGSALAATMLFATAQPAEAAMCRIVVGTKKVCKCVKPAPPGKPGCAVLRCTRVPIYRWKPCP